jgi:hypothetical protein
MVAITKDHGVEVALPPILEVKVIIHGILPLGPAIEHLIHHEQAKPVASIKQGRRGRIVCHPKGVESRCLQQLDFSFFGAIKGGDTKNPIVAVNAASLQFISFAIERQPLSR